MNEAFKQIERQIQDAQFGCVNEHESLLKRLSGGRLEAGAKISWCHADDLEFWGSPIPHPKDWFYSGIIVPLPDVELRGPLNPEDCVVVVTEYPCEKCYIEIDWVPLFILLQTPGLHRAHVMETVKLQRQSK